MADQPKELTSAQQFFALVYHMRAMQNQVMKIAKEIAAIRASCPQADEHSNINQLEAKKNELISKARALENLVDEKINDAERVCEARGIHKFWL